MRAKAIKPFYASRCGTFGRGMPLS